MQNGKAVCAQPVACFMSLSTSAFTKSTRISEGWHVSREGGFYSAQASEVLLAVCVRGKYSSPGQGEDWLGSGQVPIPL